MREESSREQPSCDVLVVGSGLAGCAAAIEAASAGASVAIASAGPLFSGSSFYGGTWGLGLVGPKDDADADDLEKTVLDVGCGVADPVLVRTLVGGVGPAIAWLEGMGVELRHPDDASQRGFIPCFDHATRLWRGLERASLRRAWAQELDLLGVDVFEHASLLDICEQDGAVTGALVARSGADALLHIPCGAIVLAAGGLAGLYGRSLTPADSGATAQGIALAHGCSLVNAEFLQMMPALVFPVRGIVANEKAWRYSDLPFPAELLEKRSGYGPFSSRFAAREIDLAIDAAGAEGIRVSWQLPAEPPEIVASYFDWLSRDFGLQPQNEARVAMFAHASNGGLRIGADASCTGGPAGLFAAGECAGGMHGADRLGGLASASALVFGRIAGAGAAAFAGSADVKADAEPAREGLASPEADGIDARLMQTMTEHAMVARSGPGLREALSTLEALSSRLDATLAPCRDVRSIAMSSRAAARLRSARAMLEAMLGRPESLGSHYRCDFPD